jgi:hypothetical protein
MITTVYKVMDIPQTSGTKTAEYEVTDIHSPSVINDHYTAEILKEMSQLIFGS